MVEKSPGFLLSRLVEILARSGRSHELTLSEHSILERMKETFNSEQEDIHSTLLSLVWLIYYETHTTSTLGSFTSHSTFTSIFLRYILQINQQEALYQDAVSPLSDRIRCCKRFRSHSQLSLFSLTPYFNCGAQLSLYKLSDIASTSRWVGGNAGTWNAGWQWQWQWWCWQRERQWEWQRRKRQFGFFVVKSWHP